jgi:hypothetical protein
MPQWDSNPQFQQATCHRLRSHWDQKLVYTGSLFYLTNTIHHFHATTPAQMWMGHSAAMVYIVCELA